MFVRKLLLAAFVGALGLSQVACSSSSGFVQNVKFGSVEQNGVDFIEVRTALNLNGLLLSALAIPIFDPKNPGQLIGQVSVVSGLGGGAAELVILIRSDVLPNLPVASQGLLPNGTPIPVAGIDRNRWVTLSVGSASRVYLNVDLAQSKAVLGVALGVDALTTGVLANVLIPFQSNNVSGLAGIYSGAQAGQSGFALFVEANRLLDSQMAVQPALARGMSLKTAAPVAARSDSVQFLEKASNTDSIRVQRRVLQLREANIRLRAR